MGRQRHAILRQTVEVKVPRADSAWRLQGQLSRVLRGPVKRLIERACDQLAAADGLHRIARLELDLGVLSATDLGKQLPVRFDAAFRTALAQALARPAASGLSAQTAAHWELLRRYCMEGLLPWWADRSKPGQPEASAAYLLRAAPGCLRDGLPALVAAPEGVRRLIALFDDAQLAALLGLRSPDLADLAMGLLAAMAQAQPQIPLLCLTPPGRLRRALWQCLLQHGWLPGAVPSAPLDVARGVLLRVARLQGVAYTVLVRGLAGATAAPRPGGAAIAPTSVVAIAAALLAERDGAGQGGAVSGAACGRVSQPESARLVDRASADGALPAADLPNGGNEEDGSGLGNAGLVLLWPFLSALFERLGLAREGVMVDDGARQRGVAVLQYLAAADPAPPEYLLPLNKLLCGVAQAAAFELDAPLTAAETAECDRLLRAVIAQAAVFGDLSVAGLRGNFLLRAGVLRTRYGRWLLQVEREACDVLLERLPWGWQWVRLPWMDDLLEVRW